MDAGLIGGNGNLFIVQLLDEHCIKDVPGDLLEIGAFTGATTRVLGEWASKNGKRVLSVDPFDILEDEARTSLYEEYLHGGDQMELFHENVKDLPVDVAPMPSQDFFFRNDLLQEDFAFIFVDGNHSYTKLVLDLLNGWECLSNNGLMLVHDYGHDIPDVTRACDEFRTMAGNGDMRVELYRPQVLIGFKKVVHGS